MSSVHALQQVPRLADAAGHSHAQLAAGHAGGRGGRQRDGGLLDAPQPADRLLLQLGKRLACTVKRRARLYM